MTTAGKFPQTRLRRLRRTNNLRNLMRETRLNIADLVMPLFIHHGKNIKNPIQSMPGQYQWSVDQLPAIIDEIVAVGIPAVLLFGIPAHKDEIGSSALHADGVIQEAIKTIKSLAPELLVICDCCFCDYTDHGHCGVISEKNGMLDVDNDATLTALAKLSLSYVKAGCDIIAPSGMMDGVVHAIRNHLDENDFSDIPILSYAIKYASALYSPFREAAQSKMQFGDRKTYQMDPANRQEALREAQLDIEEGADMLMVKPALMYLDIIRDIKQHYPQMPLAAYQVSAEYAMLKAASEKGWINENDVMLESLIAIKRAGADIIISYFALDVARQLL